MPRNGCGGIGLAQWAVMAKAGLAALADGYGLQRPESDQCKQLGQRFFELLGDSFAPLVAERVKPIGSVGLAIESFLEFCSASSTQNTYVLFGAGKAAFAFRIDYQLVLALVDGVLNRYEPATPGVVIGETEAPIPLTLTEARIAGSVLKHAFCTLAPRVFKSLQGIATDPLSVRVRETSGLVPETLDPTEMMVVVTGQYSINGRNGAIAVGLRLASVVADYAPSVPRTGVPVATDGVLRARATLAGAHIPLAAVLGCVKLPLTAVDALLCGSIIPLGQLRGRAPRIELRVGEHVLLTGTVIADRGWYRFLIRQGEEALERSDSRI
jgi:hypothetical protein